jgi:universal stress protein A
MAKYQRILAAMDLTQEGTKVLEQAIELSQQYEATLTLINVVEHVPSVYSAESTFPEIPDIEKQLMEKAEAQMTKMQEEFKITDCASTIRSGSAKHEIIDMAEEIGADLIVAGSHGRHGLQLLLGSTANGILHLAKCDVLAVRIS